METINIHNIVLFCVLVATSCSLFTFMHWRRKWQATPVFLPGESQEQRSLVGCRLWGRSKDGFFTAEPLWKPIWSPREVKFSSVQFSCSVVSDSLRPHGLSHTRLPCPSPTPRACSNSCPSSPWCHSIISSTVVPLSSCFQSFLASGSFPVSQFFTPGGRMETKSRMVVSQGCEAARRKSFCLRGTESQFCKRKSSVDGWWWW